MKKLLQIVAFMSFAVILLLSGTADAKLSNSQMAIGGITYKMPIDEVIEQFGKPHRVKNGVYYWGWDSFTVTTWDSAKGQTDYVTSVKSAANNGFETPNGVMVGMSDQILNQAYGKADRVDFDSKGATVYIYYSEDGDRLLFRVKKAKIEAIELGHGY